MPSYQDAAFFAEAVAYDSDNDEIGWDFLHARSGAIMVTLHSHAPQNRGTFMMRSGRGVLAAMAAFTALLFGALSVGAQQADGYARASAGTRMLTLGSGTTIKMLFDATNLGSSDIEVAEITFPAGASPSGAHRHGATEIFYVVEGVLGHVVNGEEHRLTPGMVGVVKPSDEVVHRVLGDGPVKALVLWVPGGEGDRIASPDRWTPIGG